MKRFFKFLYLNIHWLVSLFLVFYVLVPLLAPVALHTGHTHIGWWIHTIYHYACHQRPERSLFFFGKQLTYSTLELRQYGYINSIIGYPFVGNEDMGYKTALCVRDIFLYSSMGTVGILVCSNVIKFTLKWWMVVAGTVPMVLDGGIQFVSEFLYYTQDKWGIELAKPFYISNNVTRAVTGTLFGITFGILVIGQLKQILTEEKVWQNQQPPGLRSARKR